MRLFSILFEDLLDATHIFFQTLTTLWKHLATYVLVVLILWLPLQVVHGILLYTISGDMLEVLTPFFFVRAAMSPDAFNEIRNAVSLNDAAIFVLLGFGLMISESFIAQNVIQCAVIQTAHTDSRGLLGYRLPLSAYLNVLVVAFLSGVLILAPTVIGLLLIVLTALISWPPPIAAFLSAIAAPAVIIAFVLLIPMTIIIIVRLTLAPQAIVIDRLGPFRAIGRSWRLLSGLRPSFMMALFIFVLAALPIMFGLISPDGQRDLAFRVSDGSPASLLAWLVLSHVFANLSTGLLIPLQVVTMTYFYRELQLGNLPRPQYQ
ncbi:MAG: hypothetical protein HC822_03780 [Oscillochloris sp.]|nr:hypothetical protein [Oscillochloris sp.]